MYGDYCNIVSWHGSGKVRDRVTWNSFLEQVTIYTTTQYAHTSPGAVGDRRAAAVLRRQVTHTTTERNKVNAV